MAKIDLNRKLTDEERLVEFVRFLKYVSLPENNIGYNCPGWIPGGLLYGIIGRSSDAVRRWRCENLCETIWPEIAHLKKDECNCPCFHFGISKAKQRLKAYIKRETKRLAK